MSYRVSILGTRGIPARHGGFETFAQELALDLVAKHVDVSVYCQSEPGESARIDEWRGVERTSLSGMVPGALGTVLFDLRCVIDVIRRRPSIVLTLGYNTAVFCILLRLAGIRNVINMDGIEWKRSKWGRIAKVWFRFNEWVGALAAHRLIADHPEIAKHLERHGVAAKMVMIPYGAHGFDKVDEAPLRSLGVTPDRYFCVIARPEPENSILEIIKAFSLRRRNAQLLVLGTIDASNPYHRALLDEASDEVVFCGAIYDETTVAAIRFHCIAYLHGHTVGGTNPSLVEALGARAAVIAQDNPYNRWVASEAALYFSGVDDLDVCFSTLLTDPEKKASLRRHAAARHDDAFRWPVVLNDYERLLSTEARIGS
jgi:glycosyltransferase involved in cell wall biosynthesis